MKRLLQLGLLVGFAGTLAAVYFVPWIGYERFASEATVVANGGRSERFLIQLPSDLIQAGSAFAAHGMAGAGHTDGDAAPAAATAAPVLVEHFKLRDVNGNVLGVAARHWTESDGVAAWVLVIPSRGTLVAAGAGADPRSVETALSDRGWRAGADFAAQVTLDLVPDARSVAVTGEFGDIAFALKESRVITGIDSGGAVRGTIMLDTIGTRRP